jgi:intracellular multiplication protein IcmS
VEISKKLCNLAKEMRVGFTLRDKTISHEEVFADTGLLPALAKRANQLCSLCLGYGIGVVFEDFDKEKSIAGTKVQFDEVTPNALRFLCICDVLYELIRSSSNASSVALDELLYD